VDDRAEAATAFGPTLFGEADAIGYATPQVWDEMVTGRGGLRPHWVPLMRQLSPLDPDRMADRVEDARRFIRQNGVTYNVYGDPLGLDRLWPLDLVPLVLPADEWRTIEAGAVQRARLLDAMLADLYGPQALIAEGAVPAPAVFGDAGFLWPCRGLPAGPGPRLHLAAFDLARGPDGRWRATMDRTQAPSGAGYALENRVVAGRVMGDALRGVGVQPLGPFFAALERGLRALARPDPGEEPRVVLLSSGPFNETYFEHAYLARHLGFPLVEGADLTVRNATVYLKTIEGLSRVHVVLRRLDDDFCDPLELRPESALGVAGLLTAVRAGRVALANPLGTGLLESAAVKGAMPDLARRLLGEDLILDQAEQWWCGTPEGLRRALAAFDRLAFGPASARRREEPVEAARLPADRRAELRARVADRPQDFVAHVPCPLSTGPAWIDGRLQPRPVLLRVFAAAVPEGDGWTWRVMPGGLTRFAPAADRAVMSMQAGSGSKDTWVLAAPGAAAEVRPAALRARSGPPGALPSRAADGLYWLGRYAERADGTLALLRTVALRLVDVERPGAEAEMPLLRGLLAWSGLWPAELASLPDAGGQQLVRAVHAACFDPNLLAGLRGDVQRMYRCASAVRDRLSPDLWRMVVQLDQATAGRCRVAAGPVLDRVEAMLAAQAAMVGIEEETVLRGPSWRFLRIGRRLERALRVVGMVQGLARLSAGAPDTFAALDLLLELGESEQGYRERYAAAPQRGPVLAHVLSDAENPRSLVFQMAEIEEALAALPPDGDAHAEAEARVADARRDLETALPTELDGALAERLETAAASLRRVSELLTAAYFSHAVGRWV